MISHQTGLIFTGLGPLPQGWVVLKGGGAGVLSLAYLAVVLLFRIMNESSTRLLQTPVFLDSSPQVHLFPHK